jgi:hypothetical protein
MSFKQLKGGKKKMKKQTQKNKTSKQNSFFAVKQTLLLAIALIILSSSATAAQNDITFHGKLTNSTNGKALSGTYSVNFKIYDVPSAGTALWSDTQSITTDTKGVYNAILPNINLEFNESYWLGIEVASDGEMTPRINLTSSPYSAVASKLEEGANITVNQICLNGECRTQWFANSSTGISPSFRAYKTSDDTLSVGWNTVTWESENFDSNNDFDLATNKFVASVPGKYYFNTEITILDAADSKLYQIGILKNGATQVVTTSQASAYRRNLKASDVLDLDVGDEVTAGVWTASGYTGHINSTYDTSNVFTGARIDGGNGLWQLDSTNKISYSGNVTVGNNVLFVNTNNNRVGIGGTTASNDLHIFDADSTGGTLVNLQNVAGGDASFQLVNGSTTKYRFGYDESDDAFEIGVNSFGNNNFVMDSSGKIGIGTTSPLGALDVNVNAGNDGFSVRDAGTDQVELVFDEGNLGVFGIYYEGNVSSPNNLLKIVADSAADGTRDLDVMTFKQNGYVGVGTDSPSTNLHIVSESNYFPQITNQHSGSTAGSGPYFINRRSRGTEASPSAVVNGDTLGNYLFSGYNGSSWINSAYVNVLVDGSVGSMIESKMRFLTSSSSGTGAGLVINPDRSIILNEVYSDTVGATNRDLYIDNTGKLGYVSSSLRYKENIRSLDIDSQKIFDLNPIKFDYKNENQGLNQYGLIAEEVHEVNPELVSYQLYEIKEDGSLEDLSYFEGMEELNLTYNETTEITYEIETPEGESQTITKEVVKLAETVQYSKLTPLMLNELKKLKEKVDLLESIIESEGIDITRMSVSEPTSVEGIEKTDGSVIITLG